VNTFCILQVEDTDEDVFLMEYAVREAGIKNVLKSVSHGQEAIAYLSGAGKYADRCRFPLPGLILLDLKMPGMSGLEVLHWLRNESAHRTTPVIILTSSRQAEDIEQAYEAGANAYITKPSGVVELIEILRALDGFWVQHAQCPKVENEGAAV
jgi:CheY-like chemotaxis protein